MAKDPKDTVDELNDSFASLRDSIREISEELFIKINKISFSQCKVDINKFKKTFAPICLIFKNIMNILMIIKIIFAT